MLATAGTVSSGELRLKIVVWDNTPNGRTVEQLPEGVMYVAAPENPGLAMAYNYVLTLAEAEGYEWLLTLDQDSVLPENFLRKIAERIRESGPVSRVGAIVPQVIAGRRMISPFSFLLKAYPRFFPPGFTGSPEKPVYAANSGSVVRVKAAREIGGYDPLFPLDLSDTSLFHRLHASGKRVFIAGDLQMQHDFALHNKQLRMSIQRYDASLRDDCAFWDMYMGPLARFERIIRFTVRALRELVTPKAEDFRRRTVFELRRRLFITRKARLEEWRAWATERRNKSLAGVELQQRATEPVRADLPYAPMKESASFAKRR